MSAATPAVDPVAGLADGELVAILIQRLSADAEPMDPEHFQKLFGAIVVAYSRASEQTHGHVVPYCEGDGVRPTDALRAAGGLLRESDISSFELAMLMNL